MARATRPADEQDLAAIEQTFAPGSSAEEMLRTSDGAVAALDFLDSALARPPKLSEPVTSDTGENVIASMDGSGEGGADFEEEVIIADDLAEMIDAEEEAVPQPEDPLPEDAKAKRSMPPPIPRH
jgi:hypothetical protein